MARPIIPPVAWSESRAQSYPAIPVTVLPVTAPQELGLGEQLVGRRFRPTLPLLPRQTERSD